MEQRHILTEFDTLPPEAQRQVVDFIAFLQMHYRPSAQEKTKSKSRLSDEKYVGIWRNRENLRDSSAWVRNSRATEWGNSA
jgi:Protein of unknown function (DUF2281)